MRNDRVTRKRLVRVFNKRRRQTCTKICRHRLRSFLQAFTIAKVNACSINVKMLWLLILLSVCGIAQAERNKLTVTTRCAELIRIAGTFYQAPVNVRFTYLPKIRKTRITNDSPLTRKLMRPFIDHLFFFKNLQYTCKVFKAQCLIIVEKCNTPT